MTETPELRWFDEHPKCARCGKDAHGKIMGAQNQSFGWHCRRCAETRLSASRKVREQTA
jgi:ribosomal protein L37E